MRLRRLFRVSWVLFGLLAASPAGAQSASADAVRERTLRELLVEVRLLRQVLQATSVASVRAQILLAQRQGHADRVSQLERSIADSRTQSAELQEQMAMLDDSLAQLDGALLTDSDPDRRVQREAEIRQLVTARDQVKQRDQRLRERELEMATSLSDEKARLGEIDRGLDRVEREFDELPSKPAAEPAPR